MADIQVLDKALVNTTMTPKLTSQQNMYSFEIPSGTLSNESRLRIKLILSRVVGTPLNNSSFACEICHDDALPGAQELSEVRTITVNPGEGQGSFAFIEDTNGEDEIYQAIYVANEATEGIFDENKGLQLYKIRETSTARVAKILTTTDDDLRAGSLMVGISDEPAYAIFFLVSFFSTAAAGIYLYLPNRRTQYFLPVITSSYGYFSLLNNIVYTISDSGIAPDNKLYKFSLNGTVIGSSLALPNAGFVNIRAYQAFGDFLFVLSQDTIIKISTSSLAIIATYPLGRTPCRALTVVSSNLIYFFYGDISIAYLDLGKGTVTDVDTSVTHTTTLTFNDGVVFPIRYNMFFNKITNSFGYIYLGNSNSGTILKIGPIGCP